MVAVGMMRALCAGRAAAQGGGGSLFCALSAVNPSTSDLAMSKRFLKSKRIRDVDPETVPPPWPYKEKGYGKLHMAFDYTLKRLSENSKLIVVEGNIGSGKSSLAKKLADELDFYHIPERNFDHIMINSYGIDKRDYYHLLPESCRMPDLKMFYENPTDPKVASMQLHMYVMKFEAHLNALAHILNTGQGVVMERSPWSDFVFVNAMREKEIVSHEFFRFYWCMRKATIPELHLWPHLVIYLDRPVHSCMEQIKKRGTPEELNGKVIDFAYLEMMHESYKDFIKEMDQKCHLLLYDWSEGGEVEQVVEDIEKLDLDFFEWHAGEKLEEWHTDKDGLRWNYFRHAVTQKYSLCSLFEALPKYEVEELFIPPEDFEQMIAVYKKFVYGPYQYGYNSKRGDSVWKMIFKPENWHRPSTIQPWYDHYYRDVFWEGLQTLNSWMDRDGQFYSPAPLH